MRHRFGGAVRAPLVLAFLALFVSLASADKRVALIIGNDNYTSLRQLKNPTNDALDIASALNDLGFDVVEKNDLTRAEMIQALRDFAAKTADADVSVLYYAGHGLQLESRNYLVPVDAQLESEDDIRNNTIDFDDVLQELSTGSGAHIVFLDACRNNPLPDYTDNGLAPPKLPKDFLIAYSAAPGQVASDGSGRNSPFASALLRYLPEKGKDLSVALMNTRRDMLLSGSASQLPTDWSTLSKEVILAPGVAEQFTPETLLWQLAANQKDADLLKVYRDRYPDGPHVADAEALSAEVARGSGAQRSQESPEDSKRLESLLWTLAKKERARQLVELYLARYPDGDYAAEAKTLLDTLPASDEVSADVQCQRLATHPSDATGSIHGVPAAALARHRDQAIAACREAVAAFPDNPYYEALLARALAGGRAPGETIPDEAIKLYEDAAKRGNPRAMVSLGLLKQTGNGVPKESGGRTKLYPLAADLGHPNGAVRSAIALWRGAGVEKNVPRAVDLLNTASGNGSALATYEPRCLLFRRCRRLASGSGTAFRARPTGPCASQSFACHPL